MKKRMLSFLLVICMITAVLPLGVLAAGDGTIGNPWESNGVKVYRDGSTLHVFGSGAMESYGSIEDTPWYEIGGQIDTIVIESSVTKLGDHAFGFGSVTNVRLKRNMTDVLELGEGALPVGVKVALEVCGSGNMPDYNSNQPWANLKTNVESVTIAETVGSIGAQAFSGCIRLKSVVIPGAVAAIGQQAFADCTALTDVTLRHDFASNLTIGAGAFPTGNAGFKIAMEITGTAAVPNYADPAQQPWANIRSSIKTLTIGGNVAGIGQNAFAGCTSLMNVTMYFNENSGAATKQLGVDWFREHDTGAVINVVAVSADKAFSHWANSTFANEKNASTVYYYNRDAVNLEAHWNDVEAEIVVKPAEAKDYGRVAPGYEALEPYAVTVRNTGNKASGQLLVELSGGNTSAFTLSTKYIDSLPVKGSATFTVTPATGLGVGYYTTEVVVSDDNGTIARFRMALTVSTTTSRAEEVVTDFYKYILGRGENKIDDEEVAKWVAALANGTTVAQVASNFYNSQEFVNRNLNNDAFLDSLYLALLGRTPDAGGKANWKSELETGGKSRSWVFAQICNSAEFKNRMNHFELTPGSVAAGGENGGTVAVNIDGYPSIKSFATRLYTIVLDRTPDEAGLNDWSTQLINKTSSGAVVAAGFFGSAEYVNRNRSNRDFVVDLYKTMMDRTYDEAGLNHWLDYLAAGKTRAWVFNQFCISQEFKNLCNAHGIIAGSVDPTKYNMGKSDVTVIVKVENTEAETLVKSFYQELLGRLPVDGEEAGWVNMLTTGNASAAMVAANIAGSAEFRNRNLTNEAYVKALFKALLGRDATAQNVTDHVKLLTGGASRSELFGFITKGDEYKLRCNKLGVSAGTINPASYNMGTYVAP